MAIMMIIGIAPTVSFAAGEIEISEAKFASGYSQGQMSGTLIVKIKKMVSSNVSDVVISVDSDLPSGQNGVSPTKIDSFTMTEEEREFRFSVDLENALLGKYYSPQVKVSWKDSSSNAQSISKSASVKVEPSVYDNTGQPNKQITFDSNADYAVSTNLEIVSPAGGLNAGSTSMIELKITNKGNSRISNVVATFAPGASMSLTNSSVEQRVGNIDRSATQIVKYPIFVDADHQGGNTPLQFTIKGTDPNGKEFTNSITEYVMVNAGASSSDTLSISEIKNPSSVAVDQNFSVSFNVKNHGSQAQKNVKVTVEPSAPVVNRTKNIFVVSLEAGESKSFDVQMFAPGTAEIASQNYPIKISVEPSGKNATPISQYTGVFVNGGNSTKTVPQIIITNYNYGDSAVVANEVFTLTMVLKNTNSSQTLRNIKVSLNAEEGVFIPHNTSNSFFIDSIGPSGSVTKTIELMTKPDAPEKTIPISVDMSYEDSKGNPISVKDSISVPVVQQRRLVIDDINPTDAFFVGQQGNISVQYYNLGKNTLNNLVISAEGDFTFPQSTKMFVGKFDGGKSDFYDLQLIPTHEGEASGKVIFTFEDSNGKEIVVEKEFKITAMEEIIVDPEFEDFVEPPQRNWVKYVVGAAILGAAGATTIVIRKKKKKKNDSLDIDNE